MVYYQIIIEEFNFVCDVSSEILIKSDFFKAMLQNGMKEKQTRDIILKDISVLEVNLLLKYLHHSSKIFKHINGENLELLFHLFDRFQIPNAHEEFISSINNIHDVNAIYNCIKQTSDVLQNEGIDRLLTGIYHMFTDDSYMKIIENFGHSIDEEL